MSAVLCWQGELPPVNEREALRYAGVKEPSDEMTALLHECVALGEKLLAPRVCYAFYPVRRVEGGLDLTPIITHRFRFTDFEKGFEAMNTGKSGKVVLDWTK